MSDDNDEIKPCPRCGREHSQGASTAAILHNVLIMAVDVDPDRIHYDPDCAGCTAVPLVLGPVVDAMISTVAQPMIDLVEGLGEALDAANMRVETLKAIFETAASRLEPTERARISMALNKPLTTKEQVAERTLDNREPVEMPDIADLVRNLPFAATSEEPHRSAQRRGYLN